MPEQIQFENLGQLDLTNPDSVTPEEIEAFNQNYVKIHGRPHVGLSFWFDDRPDVLKRYRLYLSQAAQLLPHRGYFSYITLYGLTGFSEGIRYCVHGLQLNGMTKAQVLEGLAITFLHSGPRGMEGIARALADYEWREPDTELVFPEGWSYDATALDSGLDYSTRGLSPSELTSLQDWYMKYLGEVPGYVRFMGRYRPELLKAYRNRFEHCLRTLPIQVLPTTLLHWSVITSNPEGMRENVLLCKGFGVSRHDTLRSFGNATVYGGMEAMSILEKAAGDVFDHWDD